MPKIGLNATQAEIKRGILFSEKFKSSADLVLNGGVASGTPAFTTSGISMAATDSVAWPISKLGLTATNSVIAELTPGFEATSSNPLVNSTWKMDEKNYFTVATDGVDICYYLNGVKFTDAADFAFTNDFITITSSLTIHDFLGTISKLQIFGVELSEQELIDICNDETYTYVTELYSDIPCNHRANDLIGNRAKDISGYARHAILGDGVTASTMPVKLLEKNGYYFNGSTHYLSGLTEPEDDFTVVVCSRVNEVVSVTFEEDLTTFNKLIANGLFSGYLLSLRIFNMHLTDIQKCNEEILLLNRIDQHSLAKSCISDLISEGSCVLYHDYRRGSFKDLSEYGNHGLPSSTLVWDEDSLDFSEAEAFVVVGTDSSINIAEGTIIVLSDFNPNASTEYLISKRNSGGTSFELIIDNMGNSIKLYDGTYTREVVHTAYNVKCIAVNFNRTETSELYLDGQNEDYFVGISNMVVDDAPMIIGCKYDFSNPSFSKIKAVLMFNRKLSAEEHSRVYEELSINTFETDVYAHTKLEPRETLIIRDNGLLAAYDGSVMESNVLKNLKQDLYNITLDGQVLKNTYFNSLISVSPGHSLSTGIDYTILDHGGVSHTLCALVKLNSFQTSTSKIISLFGKGVANGVHSYPRCGGAYVDWSISGRKLSFSFYDPSTSTYKTIKTTYAAELNVWYYIVYSIDHINKLAYFYVNGVLVGTTAVVPIFTSSAIRIDTFRFFGTNSSDSAVVDSPNVEMNYMQVYKGVKDLTWVSKQFESYKKACLSTSFGVQESIIAEVALTNTDFQNANYVMLVDDIIENQHCKVIEGSVSSAINIKVKYLE
jgi:hypothetical protein